jgi:hypothetical protein
MNVAGKQSRTLNRMRANTDNILQTLSKRQIHTNQHLPLLPIKFTTAFASGC